MKILYVCDKLITFILNEVIELKAGNDVTILAYYSERIFNSITKPILIRHGLEQNYYKYRSSNFRGKKKRYIQFMKMIMHDLLVCPVRTIRIIHFILNNFQNPRLGFIIYFEVRDVLDQQFDVIHSPFSTPDAIDKVYFLSRILNVPFTLCFRAHDIYHCNAFSELKKKVNVIRKASRLITISNYNKEHLKSIIDADMPVEIIHSALYPDYFIPDKNIERSHNSILSVCRLTDQKGVIYLVEACHILQKRNIDYECTIIGEGPAIDTYKKRIDEKISELQIPGITFINYVTYGEIKEYLSRSTVFVLPCVIAPDGQRDILANVLKEAMAMQVPVITSDICGIEELVDDGISGILTRPEDPEHIADAVEKIFSQPETAKSMGEEGRRKIEKHFNTRTETGKLDRIFRDLVDQKRSENTSREEGPVMRGIIQ
jgi:glycosyltransferase involved in cell wall biosynthesis